MKRLFNRMVGWFRYQRDYPFWESYEWSEFWYSVLTGLIPALALSALLWLSAMWAAKVAFRKEIAAYHDRIVVLEYESSNRLEEVNALTAENEQLRAELQRLDELMEQGNADDVDESVYNEKAWTPAGEFRIYHYCPCEDCCGKKPGNPNYGITATGTVATAGRTIAVDPDVIPLGSEVLINGVIYIAEDTGVQGKTIDLFVDDHAQAAAMGTYITGVWWR